MIKQKAHGYLPDAENIELWCLSWAVSCIVGLFNASLVRHLIFTIVFVLLYGCVHACFQTRIWREYAGAGGRNVVPTIFYYSTGILLVLPVCLITLPLLLIPSRRVASFTAKVFFTFSLYLLGAPVRTKYRSVASIPGVFVFNHVSFVDNMAIAYYLGGKPWTVFVAWKMKLIPPFCMFLWGRAVFLAKGKGVNPASYRSLKEKLREGYNVVLFPEGTRLMDSDVILGHFKTGAFRLACEMRTKITPVAIIGAHRYAWVARGYWWLCPGPIELIPGTAVDSTCVSSPEELQMQVYRNMKFVLDNFEFRHH